jgi:hypothetical protein
MLPEFVSDTGKYTSCCFRVMSVEKVQTAIIPKLGKEELLFFALHF